MEKEKPWPNEGLCSYVYERVIEKSNDLTEEVIYSLPLVLESTIFFSIVVIEFLVFVLGEFTDADDLFIDSRSWT